MKLVLAENLSQAHVNLLLSSILLFRASPKMTLIYNKIHSRVLPYAKYLKADLLLKRNYTAVASRTYEVQLLITNTEDMLTTL